MVVVLHYYWQLRVTSCMKINVVNVNVIKINRSDKFNASYVVLKLMVLFSPLFSVGAMLHGRQGSVSMDRCWCYTFPGVCVRGATFNPGYQVTQFIEHEPSSADERVFYKLFYKCVFGIIIMMLTSSGMQYRNPIFHVVLKWLIRSTEHALNFESNESINFVSPART